jgi:sugar phosphate isomerase/epimerase
MTMKLISRRDFGKVAAGTLGGTALASVTPLWSKKIAPSVFGGVEIGVQSYSFHDRSLEKALAAMVELGIPNFELWEGHLDSRKASEDEFRAWSKRFQAAGIKIVAYCAAPKNDWTDEQIHHAFHCAKLLGTNVLTASISKQIVPRLDKACQKFQMKLGIHNHWFQPPNPAFFESPQDYVDVLKASSKWVGANLDVGHFYAAGYDPVKFIDEHFERIIHVHLKDRGKDPQHTDRPFGEGGTPLTAIALLLKKRAFKYAANIEWEVKDADPVQGVAAARDYLKKVLA